MFKSIQIRAGDDDQQINYRRLLFNVAMGAYSGAKFFELLEHIYAVVFKKSLTMKTLVNTVMTTTSWWKIKAVRNQKK